MTLYITQRFCTAAGGRPFTGIIIITITPIIIIIAPKPPKSEDSGGYAHKLTAKCILKKHERHTYRAFRNGGGNSTPSSKSALISSVFSGTVLYCTASVCLCVWGERERLDGGRRERGREEGSDSKVLPPVAPFNIPVKIASICRCCSTIQ